LIVINKIHITMKFNFFKVYTKKNNSLESKEKES
jgi:hypothetical protein